MVGPLLILLATQASAACPDLDQQVDWAQEEVLLEVDAEAGRTALDKAEAALGCGPPASEASIARLFLVHAAVASLEGDAGGANDAFAAAHRADPDTWIDALGPKLRSQYEAAAEADAAPGSLDVQAPTWEIALNGARGAFPARVPSGLHVVQVHDGREVAFGRVLWVAPGEEAVVDPGLGERAAPAEKPVAEVAEVPEEDGRGLQLSIGLGGGVAFGEALAGTRADGADLSEPAAKITVPLELGVVLWAGDLWIRPSVGLAPLLGGRFLWAGADGAASSMAAGLADLAVAADLGAVHAGGMVGIAYPGRIALRGLVGIPLGESPLLAEARAGVHVATAGRIEPAVGLSISARVP